MTPPLQGIKVLDLSRLGPGPYCTMILADLGADVLRIEEPPPAAGRRTGSLDPRVERTRLANTLAHGRNKRSMVLNLKSETGREIFLKLAKDANVVVDEFRPGVLKRLGVDYDTASKLNPQIIYCSITGYGQDGPYRDLVGHDINYISIAGALGTIGHRDGRPAIPLNLIADYAGGSLNAVIGILAALMARQATGRGQQVDVSMTDGVVSMLSGFLSHYFVNGEVVRPEQSVLSGGVPYYTCYQTKDGKYISIGCIEPWFWAALCRALGREDLIPYQNAEADRKDWLFAELRQVFLTRTRDEWFDLLSQSDICVGKVYSLDELDSDPQLRYRNMLLEIDQPQVGRVKQVGIALRLSDTPGEIRSPAPSRGQHTDAVLHDLGYSPEQIQALRQAAVVA